MIRRITSILIIVVALAIIGWDIYAAYSEYNSTVSVVITDWSRRFPTLAMFFGILVGHWFAPAKGSDDK